MSLYLHIDHVVLDGLPVPQSAIPELREALEAALTNLLAGRPPAAPASRPRATTRMPAPSAGPVVLAGQIAAAVHEGVFR
ncbi:hypothetical protein ACFRIB_01495 [Streptomyces mirabilis]|uniref:hypothetical protein n=1 Tax=Streptomyces mirabilis TaxID=68239 RepID=UPI0036C7D4F9